MSVSPAAPHPYAGKLLGYLAAIFSALCLGLLWAVNKRVTGVCHPGLVAWVEATVAATVLLSWNLWRFRSRLWPSGTPTLWLLTFGSVAVVIFYCRVAGVALTNPTTGALVVGSEIVLIFLYSLAVLRERPAPWGWLGAAAIILGVLAALDLPHSNLISRPAGIIALLTAAFGTATNAIIIKLHFGRVRPDLAALVNVSCQCVILGLILGLAGRLAPLAALWQRPETLALLVCGGLLIAGVLTSYYAAMKRIPLWAVRLLALLTPVVAAAADRFWLGSAISPNQLVGLLLVSGGAVLVILSGHHGHQRVCPC